MIQTTLNTIKMKNPFMLASGILGVNAAIMKRVADAGCGAIVTKSIGLEPRKGYPNPTVVELGNGNLLNAMGLPNPGCEEFLKELYELKKKSKIPIITSIFGKDVEEFTTVAKTLIKGSPDGFELNISCPHGGKYGAIIGQDPELVKEITKEVKKTTGIPVFVKISPNLTDLKIPVKAAIDGGADGIVLINTVHGMAIDLKYKKPILSNKFGGLSGPAIKPIAIKFIYEIFSEFGKKVPLIGVGGVVNWQDVIEFLLAGATAVQVGTAIGYCQDPIKISIFKELIDGLINYLKTEGFNNVSELIGLAHQ